MLGCFLKKTSWDCFSMFSTERNHLDSTSSIKASWNGYVTFGRHRMGANRLGDADGTFGRLDKSAPPFWR